MATIDYEEGVRITPFNLDEEMQEGHFDSEGNYFVNKDKEIKDNWLDNIDWVQFLPLMMEICIQTFMLQSVFFTQIMYPYHLCIS